MTDREKIIMGLERSLEMLDTVANKTGFNCTACPYFQKCDSSGYLIGMPLMKNVLALLKEQEPRVMTLEEVITHYSLPPVFVDDFGAQEDYYEDIQPLYFDFPYDDDPWIVHWRRRSDVVEHLNEWAPYYGRKWRCWTGKPTKEQREATPWID